MPYWWIDQRWKFQSTALWEYSLYIFLGILETWLYCIYKYDDDDDDDYKSLMRTLMDINIIHLSKWNYFRVLSFINIKKFILMLYIVSCLIIHYMMIDDHHHYFFFFFFPENQNDVQYCSSYLHYEILKYIVHSI